MSNGALIGVIVGGAVLVLVVIAVMAQKNAKPKQQKICGGCRRVMLPVVECRSHGRARVWDVVQIIPRRLTRECVRPVRTV